MSAGVVLAAGLEARGVADTGHALAAPGRELVAAVRRAADAHPGPVVVVPLGFGREPSLVADSARSLRPLATEGLPVALAGCFGDTGHLVAHLRSAVRRGPGTDAVLVTSPSIDPFADAGLFRIARLVGQFGAVPLVEVAFTSGARPDVDEGRERCRLLGHPDPLVVEATMGVLGAAATRVVVDRRVHEALHRLDHGDDGLDSGAAAEDGHGYAHSHVMADGSVVTHSH